MAITNRTVLKKMSNEIQEAMLQHGNEQKVREHVRSVRLLADLLLDQEESPAPQPTPSTQEPTVEEIRQMMGNDKPSETKSTTEKPLDHDDANGSSIFDF